MTDPAGGPPHPSPLRIAASATLRKAHAFDVLNRLHALNALSRDEQDEVLRVVFENVETAQPVTSGLAEILDRMSLSTFERGAIDRTLRRSEDYDPVRIAAKEAASKPGGAAPAPTPSNASPTPETPDDSGSPGVG